MSAVVTAPTTPASVAQSTHGLRTESDGVVTGNSFRYASGSYQLVAMPDAASPDRLNVRIAKTEFGPANPGDIAKLALQAFPFMRAVQEAHPTATVRDLTRTPNAEVVNRVPHSLGTASAGFEQKWARSGPYSLGAAIDERNVEAPRIVIVIVKGNGEGTSGDISALRNNADYAVAFMKQCFPHHTVENGTQGTPAPVYDKSPWGNLVRS